MFYGCLPSSAGQAAGASLDSLSWCVGEYQRFVGEQPFDATPASKTGPGMCAGGSSGIR